jgi:hypothetical protein
MVSNLVSRSQYKSLGTFTGNQALVSSVCARTLLTPTSQRTSTKSNSRYVRPMQVFEPIVASLLRASTSPIRKNETFPFTSGTSVEPCPAKVTPDLCWAHKTGGRRATCEHLGLPQRREWVIVVHKLHLEKMQAKTALHQRQVPGCIAATLAGRKSNEKEHYVELPIALRLYDGRGQAS